MEKGRRRPPDAFKLGGWGRGTFPECSFGDNDRTESSEPITARHLATGGCYMAEATRHYSTTERVFKANKKPVRKRDYGADFSRYFYTITFLRSIILLLHLCFFYSR